MELSEVFMKKIFIYGDSNVWGDNFFEGVRIPDCKQWPNILQGKLGDGYLVYQEGLPGRIAGDFENEKKYKNGKDTFLATFRTKAPVDYIFIMLGTNDLQSKYDRSSSDVISDLLWYKDVILKQYSDLDDRKKYFVDGNLPKFVYILPANFSDNYVFNDKSYAVRSDVIDYFMKNFSTDDFIVLNDMSLFPDGIHLNYEGHEEVALKVLEVIGNE
jgi:lysophospholipase L1-like esterase